MRLSVEDTALPDLLEFLGARPDVVAAHVDDDEIRVSLLGSYSAEAMRMQLYLLIRAWEAGRSAPVAEIVSDDDAFSI